ncbi:MAG TPA: Hpt domain-containing protein, partial [bacterium]
MDLEKYRELFFTESREYIETMFNLLQKLSGDSTNKTALNEIFRAAHSIKGMAASMEYKDISNLAHAIENLFEKLRTSGDIATDDQIKEIFPYIEALDSLIRHEQGEAKPSVDIYSLINKIESQEKAATAKKTEKKPAAPAKSPVLTLEASIDTAADAPAARAYMVIRKAKDLGKVISSEPDANQLREGKFYGTISINLETEFSEEAIIDAIQSITGVIKVTAG